MTRFWRTWLKIWCGAVVAFGAVLTLGASAATDAPVRALLVMLGGSEVSMTAPLRFAVALMGAVTLGWGVTLYAVSSSDAREGEASARLWRWTLGAVLGWYVVDSTLSVLTGFGLNAASNTIFLVAFLVPVLGSGVLRTAPAVQRAVLQ